MDQFFELHDFGDGWSICVRFRDQGWAGVYIHPDGTFDKRFIDPHARKICKSYRECVGFLKSHFKGVKKIDHPDGYKNKIVPHRYFG